MSNIMDLELRSSRGQPSSLMRGRRAINLGGHALVAASAFPDRPFDDCDSDVHSNTSFGRPTVDQLASECEDISQWLRENYDAINWHVPESPDSNVRRNVFCHKVILEETDAIVNYIKSQGLSKLLNKAFGDEHDNIASWRLKHKDDKTAVYKDGKITPAGYTPANFAGIVHYCLLKKKKHVLRRFWDNLAQYTPLPEQFLDIRADHGDSCELLAQKLPFLMDLTKELEDLQAGLSRNRQTFKDALVQEMADGMAHIACAERNTMLLLFDFSLNELNQAETDCLAAIKREEKLSSQLLDKLRSHGKVRFPKLTRSQSRYQFRADFQEDDLPPRPSSSLAPTRKQLDYRV